MKKIETEDTYEITCPFCGWRDRNSWERGEDGHIECDRCYKLFYFERDVRVTYKTYKIYNK